MVKHQNLLRPIICFGDDTSGVQRFLKKSMKIFSDGYSSWYIFWKCWLFENGADESNVEKVAWNLKTNTKYSLHVISLQCVNVYIILVIGHCRTKHKYFKSLYFNFFKRLCALISLRFANILLYVLFGILTNMLAFYLVGIRRIHFYKTSSDKSLYQTSSEKNLYQHWKHAVYQTRVK